MSEIITTQIDLSNKIAETAYLNSFDGLFVIQG